MQIKPALLCLVADAVVWGGIPAAFLIVYCGTFLVTTSAVAPHFWLVGLVFAAFALARIALAALVRARTARRVAIATLAGGLLAVMLLYYVSVLIGLAYWGRVISWELIASYVRHTPELADSLDISLSFAFAVLATACAALVSAGWFYAGHLDWAPAVVQKIPGRMLWVGVPAGIMMVGVGLYEFMAAPPTRQFEPVSQTFLSPDSALKSDGQAIDPLRAATLDQLDDAARAGYGVGAVGAERKNLVLIVVDALRPDHMGVYGYSRDTTPNLSRLDRAGLVRKTRGMHAVCSESACGMIGLMSSKFVHQFHNRPFTLQEVLSRHGYREHLVLSGDHSSFYGLRHAYGKADSYFDSSLQGGHRNDDRMVVERIAGFREWDGVPFMLQVHLMSAHVLGKRDAATDMFLPAGSYLRWKGRDGDLAGINYYDNGVLKADAIIGELLEILSRKGYLRNAIVAVTADHGESLGEHGLYVHGNSVREQTLRIPFLLISYGHRPGAPIDGTAFASQVDIAPTILAELGITPPGTWSGVALQAPFKRAFTYFQERMETGLIDHRDPRNIWKYWTNSVTNEQYAFDLNVDPGEQANALARVPPDRLREWQWRRLTAAHDVPSLAETTGLEDIPARGR